MDQKTYSILIKAYSILGMVSSTIVLILGILMIVGVGSFFKVPPLGTAIGVVVVLIGIMFIMMAVILFYLYLSLFLKKRWSRWVIGVLAILSAIGSLFNMPFGILTLLFEGFLAYLLLIDYKNAKIYFKKKNKLNIARTIYTR